MEYRANAIVTGFSGLTFANISSFLGGTIQPSEQTEIDSFIASYEAMLVKLCNRNFAYGDDTIYYEVWDMDRRDTFYTHNYPVREVHKIIIDGATYYEKDGSNNVYTPDTDFYADMDSFVFSTLPIMRKRRGMKIYYTIDKFWDADISLALKQWVGELQQNKEYIGKDVRKFSFASYAVEFGNITTTANASSKIPPYVLDVVNNYKKILI